MAVMRNSIIFGGVDSADYGIYIGGEGTFNAPKRDVEMISIPGRNGAFALDKGRFENIEVTYSAFNYETDLATFAQNLSDFRNAICSQKGYQRLTDTFHTDEYRMAAYISGLEIKPIDYNTASKFDIVFDCKPQRYLTSGEDPITIGEWNDTETVSGSIASFEAVEGDGVKSLVVDIEPYQSGSGTPSPDNVRPISGYDSVVTSVTEKNIFDKSAITSGYLVGHGTGELAQNANYGASDYIPIKAGHTYTYSGTGTDTFNYWYSTFYDANKQVSAEIPPSTKSFTVPDGVCFLRTTVVLTKLDVAQLEQGTTTTDYEPYNGNTYTTNLSSTRYGGTLDVASGVLTVTDGNIASYNGETLPSTWISDRDVYASGTTPTTGAQVVYELDTPTTVQLTAQEVELLVGLNQIWANSGDVSVEYGTAPNVVINPTLFEARPMLEVEGYGSININDDELTLNDVLIGDIAIGPSANTGGKIKHSIILDVSNLNTGDVISINDASCTIKYQRKSSEYTAWACEIYSTSNATGTVALNGAVRIINMSGISFAYETPKTVTGTVTFLQSCRKISTMGPVSAMQTESYQIKYNGSDVIEFDIYIDSQQAEFFDYSQMKYNISASQTRANSTKSALGDPTYIDLDIGEAYLINNGTPVSLNNVATLPAELPTLKAGANEITFDNTVTDLKIVPRWWKV